MCIDIGAVTYLPFCFKNILEIFKGGGSSADVSTEALLHVVLIFGGVAIITKICGFIQDLLFFPVINTTIRDLNMRLVRHIHAMPMHEYDRLSIQDVISFQKRMGLAIRFFMRSCLVSVVPTLLKGIFSVAVIWSLGFFRIGLFMGFILMIVFFSFSMQWYLTLRRESWVVTDRVTTALGDSILNTKYARFFQNFEHKRLDTLLFEEARSWFRMTVRMDTLQVVLGLMIGGMLACLMAAAAFAVREGTLTLGQLVLVKGQAAALFIPIRQMLMDARQVFEGTVDLEHIVGILKKDVEVRNSPAPFHEQGAQITDTAQSSNLIDIQNLTFAYPGKIDLFKQFSLSIPHAWVDEKRSDVNHQIILLSGPSGAGKSTLFKLMCGLIKPDAGSVHVLGMDVWQAGPSVIGAHMHLIPQEVFLINGTLYDNLVYGLNDVSLMDVNDAIHSVGLEPLLARLPQGMNTRVGTMGAHLSGGERQRVAFARALLHKPKILLFDETTNALDAQSEAHIIQAMHTKIPVVVLISHKTSFPFSIDQHVQLCDMGAD